ncbi:MAG: hypothetical protein AB7V46_16175 [Thermomicrobiales bacterium]
MNRWKLFVWTGVLLGATAANAKYPRGSLSLGSGKVFKGATNASYRGTEYNSMGPDGPSGTFHDGVFKGHVQLRIDPTHTRERKAEHVSFELNLSGNVFGDAVHATKPMTSMARLGEAIFLDNGLMVTLVERPADGNIVNVYDKNRAWIPGVPAALEFRQTKEAEKGWYEGNIGSTYESDTQAGPHRLSIAKKSGELTMKVEALRTTFARDKTYQILGVGELVRHSLGRGDYIAMYRNLEGELELRANTKVNPQTFAAESINFWPMDVFAQEKNSTIKPGKAQEQIVIFDTE